jgi:hypothetical protein
MTHSLVPDSAAMQRQMRVQAEVTEKVIPSLIILNRSNMYFGLTLKWGQMADLVQIAHALDLIGGRINLQQDGTVLSAA